MSIQVPIQRSRFHSANILPLFVLATLAIQVVLLLMLFFQGSQLERLAKSPAPSLVQMVDGKVVSVSAKEASYRSDAVIEQTVNAWANLTYTWSGKLPNATGNLEAIKDPGIKVVGNKKVPTTTANAAFLISDDNNFRREFLANIANLVPSEIFYGGQQTVLQISNILPPQSTGVGTWDVNLYAYMQVLDVEQPIGNPIKINQKISLRAVPPPRHPLENGLSPLQQAIYRIGEAGLQIYQIENLPD